jgi:hypothetical protein
MDINDFSERTAVLQGGVATKKGRKDTNIAANGVPASAADGENAVFGVISVDRGGVGWAEAGNGCLTPATSSS